MSDTSHRQGDSMLWLHIHAASRSSNISQQCSRTMADLLRILCALGALPLSSLAATRQAQAVTQRWRTLPHVPIGIKMHRDNTRRRIIVGPDRAHPTAHRWPYQQRPDGGNVAMRRHLQPTYISSSRHYHRGYMAPMVIHTCTCAHLRFQGS